MREFLNKHYPEIISVAKHSLIVGASATGIALATSVGHMDFGANTPYVVAGTSLVIKFLSKFAGF